MRIERAERARNDEEGMYIFVTLTWSIPSSTIDSVDETTVSLTPSPIKPDIDEAEVGPAVVVEVIGMFVVVVVVVDENSNNAPFC